MTIKKYFFLIMLLPLTIMLSACGDSDQKRIEVMSEIIKNNIKTIENKLENNELKNALILKSYINKVRASNPEHKDLLDIFAKDSTKDNANLKNFRKRYNEIKGNDIKEVDHIGMSREKYKVQELTSLTQATNPDIFNDSIIDSINFVADLSGNLPKFEEASSTTDKGSQLVGNPSYGQWKSDSSGTSFWVWYGQYRMIGDLFYGRPHYYHSWYYNRPWSYYNDYGRNIYSSGRQRNSMQTISRSNDRKVKDYGRSTGRTQSAYASRSNSKYAASTSSTKANSLSKSRNSSSYGSSHRSSSRSSGGRFGGK